MAFGKNWRSMGFIAVFTAITFWAFFAASEPNNQLVFITPYVVTLIAVSVGRTTTPPAGGGRHSLVQGNAIGVPGTQAGARSGQESAANQGRPRPQRMRPGARSIHCWTSGSGLSCSPRRPRVEVAETARSPPRRTDHSFCGQGGRDTEVEVPRRAHVPSDPLHRASPPMRHTCSAAVSIRCLRSARSGPCS